MNRFNWKDARSTLTLLWMLTPLLTTMAWLVLLMGALIFPNLLTPAVSAGNAAQHLLKICRLWYVVLAAAVLAGFPMIFLAGRFACRRLSGVPGSRQMPAAAAVCLIFPCLVIWALVQYGELPGRFFQAGADLAEIKSGFLVQAEVWINPKTQPACLPGPYTQSLAEVSTRYGIIGADTGDQWVSVYVPDALGFSLDQDRLYDEKQTISWNLEYARRYQVRYTSNFRLVVEIIPVDV